MLYFYSINFCVVLYCNHSLAYEEQTYNYVYQQCVYLAQFNPKQTCLLCYLFTWRWCILWPGQWWRHQEPGACPTHESQRSQSLAMSPWLLACMRTSVLWLKVGPISASQMKLLCHICRYIWMGNRKLNSKCRSNCFFQTQHLF